MAGDRVAEATSPRGEVFLLRREHDGALELRVNGVFVMDTAHTDTERALASATLRAASGNAVPPSGTAPLRVLIGGLGLGFTLREVLADARVTEVRVAEIEPAVVDWYRRGLIEQTAADRDDERVDIRCADIAAVLAERPESSLEAVLLDVDNGPDFLVYEDNAAVYRHAFLSECHRRLTCGGVLAVWSAAESPPLASAMREVFDSVEEHAVPVTLGTKPTSYHLFLGHRQRSGPYGSAAR